MGDAVLLSHPNSERRPTPFGRRNLTLSVSRGPAAGQLAFEPLLQVHAGLYPIVTFQYSSTTLYQFSDRIQSLFF